jgi:hypothetical protein
MHIHLRDINKSIIMSIYPGQLCISVLFDSRSRVVWSTACPLIGKKLTCLSITCPRQPIKARLLAELQPGRQFWTQSRRRRTTCFQRTRMRKLRILSCLHQISYKMATVNSVHMLPHQCKLICHIMDSSRDTTQCKLHHIMDRSHDTTQCKLHHIMDRSRDTTQCKIHHIMDRSRDTTQCKLHHIMDRSRDTTQCKLHHIMDRSRDTTPV